MSRALNLTQIIGNIGKDIEFATTPKGVAVANFTVATDESYNDKNTGQKVEQTEWHRMVAFGKTAELINQYAKKGDQIYLQGKLKTRDWEKDGIKRYTTEIIVSEFVLLGGKDKGSQPQAFQSNQAQPSQYQQPQQQPNQYQQPQYQPNQYQQPQQQPNQYQQPQQQPNQYQQPQGFQPTPRN